MSGVSLKEPPFSYTELLMFKLPQYFLTALREQINDNVSKPEASKFYLAMVELLRNEWKWELF